MISIPIKDKIYRYVLRIVGNTMDAEDIIQEVLIKIWKRKSEYNNLENPEAWCMTVARNMAIDKTRTKKHKTQSLDNVDNFVEPVESSQDPYSKLKTSDTMQLLRAMIDQLPNHQKEVIHLRDIEGYSYKEIMKLTNQSMDQVKVNLHRARKTLRYKLQNTELSIR